MRLRPRAARVTIQFLLSLTSERATNGRNGTDGRHRRGDEDSPRLLKSNDNASSRNSVVHHLSRRLPVAIS